MSITASPLIYSGIANPEFVLDAEEELVVRNRADLAKLICESTDPPISHLGYAGFSLAFDNGHYLIVGEGKISDYSGSGEMIYYADNVCLETFILRRLLAHLPEVWATIEAMRVL